MFEVTKMKYVAKEASNTKCNRAMGIYNVRCTFLLLALRSTIVDEQAKRVYFPYSSCLQYDLKLK